MSTEIATEFEQRLVALINTERAAAGLSQLKIEAHLNASAQSHSDWMGETGSLTHIGENGSSAADRIGDAGFPLTGPWRTAENLAFTSISGDLDAGEADKMHAGLMESDEHRANILDPEVSYVGIGLSVGKITVEGNPEEAAFLTQNFAETEGQVLVQEEVDGQTVLQPYQNGDPVGEPQVPDTSPPEDPGVSPPDDPEDPDEEDPQDRETASGGGCFVATAAYGSRSHPDVVDLRRFRDEVLVRHPTGRAFIRAYWAVGPTMAGLVSARGVSGRAARALISPLARLARARTDRRSGDVSPANARIAGRFGGSERDAGQLSCPDPNPAAEHGATGAPAAPVAAPDRCPGPTPRAGSPRAASGSVHRR
jgi:cysteine-rich secretory family protein